MHFLVASQTLSWRSFVDSLDFPDDFRLCDLLFDDFRLEDLRLGDLRLGCDDLRLCLRLTLDERRLTLDERRLGLR